MARKQSKDIDRAAHASRNGSMADTPQSEEGSSGAGLGRVLLLLVVAAALALVLSKDVRTKALDVLFGSEEEFDYTSTTMPATDPPVGATAA